MSRYFPFTAQDNRLQAALKDTVAAYVNRTGYGIEHFAMLIGRSEATVRAWLEDRHHFHADWIPRIVRATGDPRLMNVLQEIVKEELLERESEIDPRSAHREGSEFLDTLLETGADGEITADELARIRKEGADVIADTERQLAAAERMHKRGRNGRKAETGVRM